MATLAAKSQMEATTVLNRSKSDADLLMTDYFNKHCDPRTVDFWLMSNGPWKLIAITLAYISIVVLGKRMMRDRKPFECKVSMMVYNVTMVFINAFFLYDSLVWTEFGARLLDFKFPSPFDRSAESLYIVRMFYLYQWTKFVDYFDTFFFVLRKKERQITVLHIYHHISVPFVGWISSWISPTMPVLGLFAMLNCFCHVIMYSYYALSSLGAHIQPYLWWKKYITQIQLIQFGIIGAYGVVLGMLHQNYPLIYRMMPISQAAIFLVMFGNFYVQSYLKNRKKTV